MKFKLVHEYERSNNISKVANKLNLSRRTVRRWLQRHRATNGVDRKNRDRAARGCSVSKQLWKP